MAADAKAASAVAGKKSLAARSESETSQDPFIITPIQLYSLIQEKSTSFLLLDTRPLEDYGASHVQHVCSLSIPEEILVAGLTAKNLERNLRIEDRSQWSRRATVDKLILLDWASRTVEESSSLRVLRDAMFRWDQSVEYAQTQPFLLLGGFENFAMHYPMLVTDPSKTRRPKRPGDTGRAKVPDVSNMEYPDLLEKASKLRLSSGEESNKDAKLSEVVMPVTPLRELKPQIPDRSMKPVQVRPEPQRNHVVPPEADQLSDEEEELGPSADSSDLPLETAKSLPPKFDRSAKAKLLLREDRGRDSSKRMSDVLEAERDLVQDAIDLEQKQLDLEHNWEQLRLKRERAAEEEMKAEMIKKEELLLEELRRVGEEKSAKDKENTELRSQLQQMKAQLNSLSQRDAEREAERKATDDIRSKEVEQRKLREQVERLRAERIRKQKDLAEETRAREKEASKAKREVEKKADISKARLRDEPSSSSFGQLSRSLSSPNIAQLLEEENRRAGLNMPMPKFDRTAKPTQTKPRNFQPVYGMLNKRGLTGLKNLGNTCYMNSVLQCLSNFTIPAKYFMNQNYERFLNHNSETHGDVAREFSALIHALWNGQYKSIAPVDLKAAIGKYKHEFGSYTQQDAHEFLLYLMGWLHSDVNEITRKVKLPEINYTKFDNDSAAADEAWRVEEMADKSFIRETFYGQRKSFLRCLTCGFESPKYEAFFELSVPLPQGSGRISLRECIANLLKPEKVSWKCDRCKVERDSVKQLSIVKFPLILAIHLTRFYEDGSMWRKKQNMVDFELRDFDLEQFATVCGGKKNRYKRYNLYGVSNHFGTMEGGHYTAYCYSQVYQKWHKYDDHEVHNMNERDVKTSAAYILFYSAKN